MAVLVGGPASNTESCRSDERAGLLARCSDPPRLPLLACGVGHAARFAATAVSVSKVPRDHRAPDDSESSALGVGHGDACQDTTSTVLRVLSLFPAALFPFCAGVPAIGVGQPAKFACRGN